jgi:DNA-binding NtrC family response regulator
MIQKILAVDDEPHMLKLLERIIKEKTAFNIMTINNSLEIPSVLEQNQFDLIITDLKMPGMDGLDVLRYIKEKKYEAEVIIITAFGSLESAIEALSHGVFDYITKPFKKEQIIYTVDRALRFQGMKKEIAGLAGIFNMEPYSAALKSFEKEYIQRLASKIGDDINILAEHSGLSRDIILSILQSSRPTD